MELPRSKLTQPTTPKGRKTQQRIIKARRAIHTGQPRSRKAQQQAAALDPGGQGDALGLGQPPGEDRQGAAPHLARADENYGLWHATSPNKR
mgnify:CR=1 FL=1